MASNDNILGAPTSGLGQAVDYTYDDQVKGMPTLAFQQGGQVLANHQGGTAASLKVEGFQPIKADTGLITALSKVAGGFIDGKVKQAEQAAFVEGQQKAMQGQAIEEIIKDQPWYSKILGAGADVIEGARQWHAADRANQLATDIERRMDIWKTYDPKTAQAEFNRSLEALKTGDEATDMAITQQVLKAYPTLMKAQSKEHWGYLQANAATAWEKSYQSVAERLQSAGKGLVEGKLTDEDMADLKMNALATILPVPGMDEENYKKALYTNAVVSAQRGDLFMLNALTDNGMLDMLKPEQRLAVEKAQASGHTKVHGDYSRDRVESLSAFFATMALPPDGYTVKQAHQTIDQINVDFKKATGSKEDFFPVDRTIGNLKDLNIKIQQSQYARADAMRKYAERLEEVASRESDKAAVAALKEETERREQSQILSDVVGGRIGNAFGIAGLNPDKVNSVAMTAFNEARAGRLTGQDGKPVPAEQLLSSNYNGNQQAIRPVQAALRGALMPFKTSLAWGENFDALNDEYQRIRNANPDAATAYYGDFDKHLKRYQYELNTIAVVNGGKPLTANDRMSAFNSAFVNPPPPLSNSEADKADFRKGIMSDVQQAGLFGYGPNQYNLRPSMQRVVVDAIADDAREYQRYDPSGPRDTAARSALVAAKANGLEIQGSFAWRRGRNDEPWDALLRHAMLPQDAGRFTDKVINDRLNRDGMRIDQAADVQVFRQKQNGEDVLMVQAHNEDGQPRYFTVRPADVVAARAVSLVEQQPGVVNGTQQQQIAESNRKDAQRNPLVSDSIRQSKQQLQP